MDNPDLPKTNSSINSENEFVFRPRARLIRTLGQELISNESVALIELVKNSFDADATRVVIRFIGPFKKDHGVIEVIDDGHGMSMETIKNAWMEPATNDKRINNRSELFRRRLQGEKGIGRFACSRLANELELITKSESDKLENYALFDWNQFENDQQYLDEIKVLAEERSPSEICAGGTINLLNWEENNNFGQQNSSDHGTILRMSKMKKEWSELEFRDLQRDLSRLISPFIQFPDFRIKLDLPEEFSKYSKEILSPEIIKYPHYSVKGNIDQEGYYKIKIKAYATGLIKNLSGLFLWGEIKNGTDSDILMLTDEQAGKLLERMSKSEVASRKIQTGPFEVELRIWDRDELGNVIQGTKSTIQDVRRDLDAIAGINIYRDGFRVLPYGEPDNDWLRLDIRRVQKPTTHLSNNQVVGYVSITSEFNTRLKDQTNREGLDENQAFDDLRRILLLLLNQIEVIRHPLRKRSASKVSTTPTQGLFNSLNIKKISDQIATKYPNDNEIRQLIDETQKELNKQVDEIQVVVARYQRLATLGTLIDVVLHDGRHPLGTILNQAILGQEDIDGNVIIFEDKQLLLNLRKRFERIEEQGSILDGTFERIEPFSGRKRGKPDQLYLEQIIKNAFDVYHSEVKKMGVAVSLPNTATLVRVDQAEIQQIILNLLQNSLYWLEYVEKGNRKIIVKVSRLAEDQIEIIFADSGPGILPEYKNLIFEPYFSTKPNGVGLGLAIVGEIVSDVYNGSLELLGSNLLPGAVFRIVLNKRRG